LFKAIGKEVSHKQAKGLWSRIVADDTRKSDAKNLADFKKYCSGTGGGRPTPQPEGNLITLCFMDDKNLWDGTLWMSIF
jgi:hypothetical protein